MDEREALERELAALLATIDAGEEEEEEELAPVDGCYTRVDVNDVLRQLSDDQRRATAAATETPWSTLLATVERCDRDVFAAFERELGELRVELLATVPLAPRADESTTQPQSAPEDAMEQAPGSETSSCESSSCPPRAAIEVDVDAPPPLPAEASQPEPDALVVTAFPEESTQESVETESQELLVLPPSPAVDSETPASADRHVDSIASNDPLDETSASTHSTETETGELSLSLLPSLSSSSSTNTSVWWQRATEQQEQATLALATWLREMEAQWTREAEEREAQRLEALQEELSRAAMTREEILTRRWLEIARRQQEWTLMASEDALATQREADYMAERQLEALAQAAMAAEEAAEWRRLRLELELHRKERREEERLRLRRDWGRVMDELTQRHRERVERQRRQQAAERLRAAREMAAMQAEELSARALLAQLEVERRRRELGGMTREDEMARGMRREMRRAALERERMQAEEIEMQRWLARQTALEQWATTRYRSWRYSQLEARWRRWRTTVIDMNARERERDQRRLALRRRVAIRAIASVVRRWMHERRRRKQAQETEEAMAAAMMLQSAFRGFHVRRKFQNALEMASRLGGDDALDEINLDELIGRPPELEDDWERPSVIPTVAAWAQEDVMRRPTYEDGAEEEEENEQEDAVEDDERVEQQDQSEWEAARTAPLDSRESQQQRDSVVAEPGGSLAAVLWNRMRHKAKKRQHQLDERQRQQDPAYRLQKVLHKSKTTAQSSSLHGDAAPRASVPAVTTSVTWSSNPDKKKSGKVKLPSLVERLRKKTAATR
ncbi:hypothetical protein P43SY_007005 [Pythium insidiosum]|uniref:Uncharacterized protein n=1 Tax=Pythium insidiosum TaxID=114742 RepID=A0AAD5LQP4_PYTIN|nr:hypothetical protein P43SY_007005 [Pythium insidiosum]